MKKIKILSLCLLLLFNSFIHADDEESHIVINIDDNIEIGDLIQGRTWSSMFEDQIVKFEILCNGAECIMITQANGLDSQEFMVDDVWKVGPVTGFEENFSNGAVYTPINDKFYLTIKINAISVSNTARIGNHTFSPSITVDYCDL